MIVRSDNDAASALWQAIGGHEGLDRANARLGLTHTKGAAGGGWGLTQTTAEDQLTLLGAVFDEPGDGDKGKPVLHATSRAYLGQLMNRVVSSQDWGVSAAADDGLFRVKNGWLPDRATGRWRVHSMGQVTAGGRTYLMVILSDGHPSFAQGIAHVEDAARATLTAVSRAAAD